MKTHYFAASSLDGFIATEHDSLDWLFALGELGDTGYPAFIAQVGALAMGSATYEWMARHAGQMIASTGSAWPYAQPAWVFTTRARPVVTGADVQAAAGGKNIWLVGGGDLAGQFHDAGLLDELLILIGSLTLGRGKPLLPRALPSPVRRIGPGMAELRYDVQRPDRQHH